VVLGVLEDAAQPIIGAPGPAERTIRSDPVEAVIGPPGDTEQTIQSIPAAGAGAGADVAAGAADTVISLAQGGVGAAGDVAVDTTEHAADVTTNFAGAAGDLTTDPALAVLGLDGGPEQRNTGDRNRPAEDQGGAGLAIAALGAVAGAVALSVVM
jgi:hypothetical protein